MAMSNRLTFTGKWGDPWFCSLATQEKMFWIYLLDNCDHAGLWQVNMPMVEFQLKGPVDTTQFKSRIIELSPEWWFIPGFIKFQYPNINISAPANNIHRSVVKQLIKYGVFNHISPSFFASDPAAGGAETSASLSGSQDKVLGAASAPSADFIHSEQPLPKGSPTLKDQKQNQDQDHNQKRGGGLGEPFDYSRMSAAAHKVVVPPKPAPLPPTPEELKRREQIKFDNMSRRVAKLLPQEKTK